MMNYVFVMSLFHDKTIKKTFEKSHIVSLYI